MCQEEGLCAEPQQNSAPRPLQGFHAHESLGLPTVAGHELQDQAIPGQADEKALRLTDLAGQVSRSM